MQEITTFDCRLILSHPFTLDPRPVLHCHHAPVCQKISAGYVEAFDLMTETTVFWTVFRSCYDHKVCYTNTGKWTLAGTGMLPYIHLQHVYPHILKVVPLQDFLKTYI